jgi:hypothetical protein
MTELIAALLAPIVAPRLAPLLIAAAGTAALLVAVARREALRVEPTRGRVIPLRARPAQAASPAEPDTPTRRAS